MTATILKYCGIEKYYSNGTIMLTSQVEEEIKQILENESRFKGKNLIKRCLWCKHHQEYMNDFCDILNKQTLCSFICDQFERKMTIKEATEQGYFDDYILGEENEYNKNQVGSEMLQDMPTL